MLLGKETHVDFIDFDVDLSWDLKEDLSREVVKILREDEARAAAAAGEEASNGEARQLYPVSLSTP